MTTRKFGRTALIAVLALSIIMSITGGTIAWFTDEVTSAGNKIEAGTLDISLLMHNGATYEDISNSTAPIFGAGSIAQNNNAETLWEPGKTQVAYLAIKNNGNLAVKYQVSLNVENVSKDLYKVMEYAIVPDAEPNDVTGWTSGKTTVVGKQTASDVVSLSVGATHYFALAIHMAEEAGNEYQGGAVNFDMTVLATQDTVENDAFDNQYDAGATTIPSYWNGKVPTEMPDTLVVDGDTQTVHVKDADAFAYLSTLSEKWADLYTDGNGRTYTNYANGAGANYYYSGEWTIVLDADIDLNSNNIDPVKLWVGESTGAPTFDGKNHTISNAKIVTDANTENEAGLFDATKCSVKNLKLDNIQVTGSNVGGSTAGILSGSCHAGISNITITNSSVTGGKYTGGVVGYGYTDVTNCSLTNVTVKGGYKLGGIIGYICASSGTGDVYENTLTDCTVDGIGGGVYAGGKNEYIVGKVVGNYNCNGICTENEITNMTTSATDNIGKIEAGKDVKETGDVVNSGDELQDAVNNGSGDIILGGDIDLSQGIVIP